MRSTGPEPTPPHRVSKPGYSQGGGGLLTGLCTGRRHCSPPPPACAGGQRAWRRHRSEAHTCCSRGTCDKRLVMETDTPQKKGCIFITFETALSSFQGVAIKFKNIPHARHKPHCQGFESLCAISMSSNETVILSDL